MHGGALACEGQLDEFQTARLLSINLLILIVVTPLYSLLVGSVWCCYNGHSSYTRVKTYWRTYFDFLEFIKLCLIYGFVSNVATLSDPWAWQRVAANPINRGHHFCCCKESLQEGYFVCPPWQITTTRSKYSAQIHMREGLWSSKGTLGMPPFTGALSLFFLFFFF